MNKYEIPKQNVVVKTLDAALPSYLVGLSTTPESVIFWKPDTAVTLAEQNEINNIVLAHKWGVLTYELKEGTTYLVTVQTEEDTVTPIVDGVEGTTLDVVDGVATFEVDTTVAVEIDTVELDNEVLNLEP